MYLLSTLYYWRLPVSGVSAYETDLILGLTYYSGNEFPEWQDDLLVPGLSIGSFWRVDFDDDEIIGLQTLFVNDRARTRKVKQGQMDRFIC